MRTLPNPEVEAARDAARRAHIASRKGWMEAARIYSKLLWPSDITRAGIRHCLSMAKKHSRVVSTSPALRRPKWRSGEIKSLVDPRCSCGTEHSTLAGSPNPGGLDEFCPVHGQDIR